MALKLKLNPEPTFKAKVGIPVPGSRPVDVVFTFKHRTREEILEWVQESRDDTDAESVADAAAGWDLDDEFTPENIQEALSTALVENLELKPRVAYGPPRVAITGRRVSPPLFESMELLGKAESIRRLAALVERLSA